MMEAVQFYNRIVNRLYEQTSNNEMKHPHKSDLLFSLVMNTF